MNRLDLATTTSPSRHPPRSADCVSRPIGQQFRDTQASRFGLRLAWARVRTTGAVRRLVLLVGLALVV